MVDMNEQKPPGSIEWCRIRHDDGSVRRGFTWNPVAGCRFGCRWEMPDGTTAGCYAKAMAEGLASPAYPDGFATHAWHPERLDEPSQVRDPAGIFISSMADPLGPWVPDEHVQVVLDVVEACDWHVFFLLTKNAPRLRKFRLPGNLWVGVSLPPTWMNGKRLFPGHQELYVVKALNVLDKLDAAVRWMSFEPLSFDVGAIFQRYEQLPLEWAVIGAASDGARTHQPDPAHVRTLLWRLDRQRTPVFFKGNLAWDHRREDFPATRRPATTVVNVRTDPYDLYIGRANARHGLPESAWANPYRIGPGGTREQVLRLYEHYLRNQPQLLDRVYELRGKRLGCWCAPEPCHGHLLARLADMSREERRLWLREGEEARPVQLELF